MNSLDEISARKWSPPFLTHRSVSWEMIRHMFIGKDKNSTFSADS